MFALRRKRTDATLKGTEKEETKTACGQKRTDGKDGDRLLAEKGDNYHAEKSEFKNIRDRLFSDDKGDPGGIRTCGDD